MLPSMRIDLVDVTGWRPGRPHRGLSVILVGVVLVLAAALASCSSDGTESAELRMAWSRVELPKGFVPSLVSPGPGASVLVTADGDVAGRRGPRMAEVHDGTATPVPIT